ncbi:cytochrome b/b6 domain-containing protein [Sulfurimonas sp.]|uniref:cytochrome b/b6 domain-containing protein n=1 Tax=Sulfurimonas sp. TaxID=2022749 RepID=UPI00286DC079|nr:cytochrome b/b6 domain-containing protein [Sulfurimonas sp.]
MIKTYIWSLFTRLFHILLIIAVCAIFLIAEFENLLDYHAIVGYTIGLLLLFRIAWGFLDVKHSKFKDFNFNIEDLKEYLLNIFGNKKEYAGHNPASSWAIIAMIILGLASVISGVVVFGTQEGMGILSFLNTSRYKDMDFFEDMHEFFTNAFMFVIFIHIAGALLDRFLHNSKAVESMIYGYKEGDGKSVKLTRFQQLFGVLWIGSALFLFTYLLLTPSNILIKDSNKAVDYRAEHEQFYKECISCHTLYPPYLLPKESWVKMMDNLESHFGDDASLDEADKNSIKDYLVKNSAQTSTKESAQKILKSIKNSDTIAVTKTAYWQNKHDVIDKSIFKSKKVGNISNCKACHKNIERGLLNDRDIQIAKGV